MIHGSSDLNFRLQVAQLVLTRMSYLRERSSLQLSEKRLFRFKSYNVGPTSLLDASREASLSADFSPKKPQRPVPVRSVCLCISLRWESRSVCAFLTGLLHHVLYSASTIAPRVFQRFKTAENHQNHVNSLAIDVAMARYSHSSHSDTATLHTFTPSLVPRPHGRGKAAWYPLHVHARNF